MEHQQAMKIYNQQDNQNMQKFIKNLHLSNKNIKLKNLNKKAKKLILCKNLWIQNKYQAFKGIIIWVLSYNCQVQ
jgi:hypothetical protein